MPLFAIGPQIGLVKLNLDERGGERTDRVRPSYGASTANMPAGRIYYALFHRTLRGRAL